MKKIVLIAFIFFLFFVGCATTEDPRPFPKLMAAFGFQDFRGNVYEERQFNDETGQYETIRTLSNDRRLFPLFLDTLGIPFSESSGC